jgi:hypothetical protein
MRRLLALACATAVAALSGAAPAAAWWPTEGHYAGETSNILLGPARIHFKLRDLGGDSWKVEDFFCGCGIGQPWRAEIYRGWFHARSSDPSLHAAAELQGGNPGPRRLEGWGGAGGPWGQLEWTWSADWIAELAAAEGDAEALGELGEEAGEVAAEAARDGAVPGPESERVIRIESEIGHLADRIAADAEHAAKAEGLPHAAAYGAASTAGRATVARLERDAARPRHRLQRRAAAIERTLRKMSAEARARHPRLARRLRSLRRRIADEVAKLRREVG